MTTHAKIALVTGGGSGMGEATCLRLARDGMAIAVLDINRDAADCVARKIKAEGAHAIALTANIADRAQMKTAIAEIHSHFGLINVLVNNAAVEDFSLFEDIDDKNWDRLMEINLKGTYIVTQEVLPDMRAQNWGRIINLASISAQTGAATMVHYAATKGGIVAMTRSLAQEVGRQGITVNAIAPCLVDTPMSRRAVENGSFPVSLERIAQAYPIPKVGKPEDIAATCSFFASEEAGYITAQLLGVNGGATV